MLLLAVLLLKIYSKVTGEPLPTYIIAPTEITGVVGSKVHLNEVFVQKVTLTEVSNETDIELVDDSGTPITEFPRNEYKATVRNRTTKERFGFVTLKPYRLTNGTPTSMNQKGEFLFYQEGRVFNSLGDAKEGKLYFWRRGKTPNSPPLILLIGVVENGTFTYKDFVEVTGKTVSIVRGGN